MPTKVRHIRVPDDVWEAAQARAHAEGTTASAVAVEALREYGQPGVRPGAQPPPHRAVSRPEPVYEYEDMPEPGCRHPSGLIRDDRTCGVCGRDVDLRWPL